MRSRTAVGLAPAALAALAMAGAGLASAEGDKALGEYLSSECVTCHQVTGQYEGIPPIVGWPAATFIEIMDEYRQKKRANAIMQTIAGRLSAEEVASLAAYFGSLSHKPAK
jgi:cytochrome c553